MPASSVIPAAISALGKEKGVIKALYDDLASPGVKQVGKALSTVLETGSIVFLPLRMLNQTVAEHEKRTFARIAERFSRIPDAQVIEVAPEMGVPIVEKLSFTTDKSLSEMFIELLASSADVSKVGMAHPSFVRVIESLSPNEAKILRSWKDKRLIPCVGIFRQGPNSSAYTVYDVLYETDATDVSAQVLSAFVSNMEGLGLIRHREADSVAIPGAYDDILTAIRNSFPEIKHLSYSIRLGKGEKIEEDDYFYTLGCLEILDYGKMFEACCFPS